MPARRSASRCRHGRERACSLGLLDHVAALGPVRLSGTATGDLATTLTDAVSGIEPYWRQWLPATATVAVLPIAILLAVLPVDWRSAVTFAVTLPLLPLFMVLAGRSAERANQRQWASMARLGGHLLDAVAGLADLVLLGAAKREVALVARTADGYRRETMKVLRLAFLSALVLEFFATVSIAVTAVLIGFRCSGAKSPLSTASLCCCLRRCSMHRSGHWAPSGTRVWKRWPPPSACRFPGAAGARAIRRRAVCRRRRGLRPL